MFNFLPLINSSVNIGFSFLLHVFPAFTPYGYDKILIKPCNLLSSLLFNAILLISSVYALLASILNICCDFKII